MRYLLTSVLLGCLVAVGCQSGTPPSTGTRASGPAEAPPTSKPKANRPAEPPGVEVTPSRVELKKGDKKKSKVSVKRQGGFDKEIKLEFDPNDTGVTIDSVTVPASKDEMQDVEITVSAGDKAKTGFVQVTATGGDLEPKLAMFEVVVKK